MVCLFVGMVVCIHAQGFELEKEAFGITESGNVIALRNCGADELADYLSTSPQIALRILEKHREDSTDVFLLRKGDSVCIDYGQYMIRDSVAGIGRIICRRLDSCFDRCLFSN